MACAKFGRSPKRYILLLIAVIETLLFSGVIFGWTSLVYVLKADGFFTHLCDEVTAKGDNISSIMDNTTSNWTTRGVNSTVSPDAIQCAAQDSQFLLIFTLASNMLAFAAILIGPLFDKAGIRSTRVCWAICQALGAALLGSARPDAPLVHLLLPAMLMYATGANCVLLSNMAVADLFGKKKSAVITLMVGAWDSSSAVFLMLKILYKDVGVPFNVICYLLAGASMLSLIPTFFLFPNKSFKEELSTAENSTTTKKRTGPKSKQLTLWETVKSRLFLSHIAYMSYMNLSFSFVIASANGWFNTLTGQRPDKVELWTNILGYFMLAGLLFGPISGRVYDKALKINIRFEGDNSTARQLSSIPVFTISVILITVLYGFLTLSVIQPIRVEEAMGLSLVSTSDMFIVFLVMVINRGFIYGGNVSFIANAFPPEYTGRLYACVFCGMGVVNSLQIPLMEWIQHNDNNPLYVYILLLCLNVLAIAHPINVAIYATNNAVGPGELEPYANMTGLAALSRRRQGKESFMFAVEKLVMNKTPAINTGKLYMAPKKPNEVPVPPPSHE